MQSRCDVQATSTLSRIFDAAATILSRYHVHGWTKLPTWLPLELRGQLEQLVQVVEYVSDDEHGAPLAWNHQP